MSRRRKLVERFVRQPPEVAYDDVETLLTMFGWQVKSTRGSHAIFTKKGEVPIVIPKHGGRRVKGTYVCIIIERLRLDELDLDEL
uniref:Type II toxin-antitoxin system HicA family toxin n=2 Tax=Thermorudis TaxID=1649508 RepID=A0A7C2WQI4_9BACT